MPCIPFGATDKIGHAWTVTNGLAAAALLVQCVQFPQRHVVRAFRQSFGIGQGLVKLALQAHLVLRKSVVNIRVNARETLSLAPGVSPMEIRLMTLTWKKSSAKQSARGVARGWGGG